MRMIRIFIVTVISFYSLSSSALAVTLYDNGPINGTINALTINYDFWVSNSFDLTGTANLTGAQIGLWSNLTDTPVSVDWSIGTTYNDDTYGFGTATLTNTPAGTDFFGNYSLWESTFPLSLALGAGTYWLTLQNAVTSQGDILFWDQCNGQSQAWQGIVASYYSVGSESFQIYGTSSVPEPSTMLLLGLGLAGLAGVRRKFQK